MDKEHWKQALISILIGSAVAFLTSLFEGLANLFNGAGNEILGGAVSSITYTLKNARIIT